MALSSGKQRASPSYDDEAACCLLIGESAAPPRARRIREMALSRQEIRDVNEFLTMPTGPDDVLVKRSEAMPWYRTSRSP